MMNPLNVTPKRLADTSRPRRAPVSPRRQLQVFALAMLLVQMPTDAVRKKALGTQKRREKKTVSVVNGSAW